MALVVTISLVVILVLVRLFLPPVPALLKNSIDKYGSRTTIVLCATALIGAVLLIVISRR